MQHDKITLKDLSIDGAAGGGVFALIDRTTTTAGRQALRYHLQHPPSGYEDLLAMQEAVKWWMQHPDKWPSIISNGTIVLLEKFFDSADSVSTVPTGLSMVFGSFIQKLFNKNQYTFIQFSLSHLADFLKGNAALTDLLEDDQVQPLPSLLRTILESIAAEMKSPLTERLVNVSKQTPYSDLVRLAYRARREMKHISEKLQILYARLDAIQAMAKATKEHLWTMPEILPALPIHLNAKGLYHPLVPAAVAYDFSFHKKQHFLFLTGANMSGKTTLLRALGVAALLAHLGMGAPAASIQLSFLNGIITNMHVEDNILKGESYFFAEVQRMKNTALRIRGEEPHLILMDELFKGTNVHDAYECTKAVVDGLLTHPNHLMVLSTHLHEVAQHFEGREDMVFACFETQTSGEGGFAFTYALKPGVSDDRIGYRILQQEGVIDLLNLPAAS